MFPIVRALSPQDSISELTSLLHRAYSANAAMGLHFVASRQTEEITRQRLDRGTSFVAEHDGRLVGTVTLTFPVVFDNGEYLPEGNLASFGQFAVEPSLQGQGIGRALLKRVEEEAVAVGADEICLDTADSAEHLIRYYERQGYTVVGRADWRPEVNYTSVIMAKRLTGSSGSERSP